MINFDQLEQTFTIAEIGSNHNQSLALAKEMIDAAKSSGADAVKFQSINIDELYYHPSPNIQKLHKKIDLEESWHYDLNEYCKRKEIVFFSAPTYLKAVDILEDIDVQLYKLASAQVGTFPVLVDKVASLQKPTLLSTGIVSYSELEKVVKTFHKNSNHNFAILHCNSLYPTPYEKANLHLIEVYQRMFGKTIGYSDHTEGIYASLAAVTMGAKIIERHFTTDKSIPIPDAKISILPHQFKDMVLGVRAIESAMCSSSRIELEEDEQRFKESILYRLVLKKKKNQNDGFTADDFEFKRSAEGIDCREMETVIDHMVCNVPLEKGCLLHWGLLKGKAL